MKNASLFLVFLMIFCFLGTYAQSKKAPTKPVAAENRLPVYKNGNWSALHKYLSAKISPMITKESFLNSSYPPTRLTIDLYIDEKGKVADVGFPAATLSKPWEAKIKAKLLTMKGWTAPVIAGKPIKSIFHYNIRCILWQ